MFKTKELEATNRYIIWQILLYSYELNATNLYGAGHRKRIFEF